MAVRPRGAAGNGRGGNGDAAPFVVDAGAGSSDYRFPASTKVYLTGTLHPELRVPMREIQLSPTHGHNGGPAEANPPLRVYDTSGPYTDPAVTVDLHLGLPRLREP